MNLFAADTVQFSDISRKCEKMKELHQYTHTDRRQQKNSSNVICKNTISVSDYYFRDSVIMQNQWL